jgi:hypothetical protein
VFDHCLPAAAHELTRTEVATKLMAAIEANRILVRSSGRFAPHHYTYFDEAAAGRATS